MIVAALILGVSFIVFGVLIFIGLVFIGTVLSDKQIFPTEINFNQANQPRKEKP